MKSCVKCAGIICLVLFCATAALAGDDDPQSKGKGKAGLGNPEALFKKLDTNGDGKLSKEEFGVFIERVREKAKSKGKTLPAGSGERLFNRIDTNKDGFISLDEFKKMREKMAQRAKNGKANSNFNKN